MHCRLLSACTSYHDNLVFPRLSSHKRKGRKIGEYGKIYEAALPASYRFPEDREAQISQKKSVYRGHAWKKQLGRYPANHVKTNHPLLGTPIDSLLSDKPNIRIHLRIPQFFDYSKNIDCSFFIAEYAFQ